MIDQQELFAMIESFLFIAGDDGLTEKQLAMLTEVETRELEQQLPQFVKCYEEDDGRGITVKRFGTTYRFVTKAKYADNIKRLLENPIPQTITKASLEVLAIIAYKQPVTRVEIDDLRGVKSEGPLQTLVSRGLIMEKGRSDGAGRAILYGTTELFLDRFGLSSLDALPPLNIEEEAYGDNDLFMTQFQEAFAIEDEGGISN